ncbi:MAG: MarR family winged helix-turn-helix transcriptional regulator [Peptococcia bacterium]
MQIEHCINFLLTKAQQNVFQYFKGKLAAYDVTPVQYAILACLWQQDGQTPSQIGLSLNIDNSTITGVLDRIEQKGLLKRTPAPCDRRALNVVLTAEGAALQKPLERIIEEANAEILKDFTPEEQKTLKKMLAQLGKCDHNNKKKTS